MAVVGLTTGAYAFLMGPVLRFLLTGGTEGLQALQTWAPSLASAPRETALIALPSLILVIGAVKGLGYLGQFYWVGLFGQRVVVDLRRQVFDAVLAMPPSQRAGRLSGDVLSRFTADIAAVEMAATYTVASWLRDSLQIVVLVGVALSLSWKLTLLALLALPLSVWPASRLTRALLGRTREGAAALGVLAGQVMEGLGALKTIQVFNAQAADVARFSRRAAGLEHTLTRAGWSRAAVPGVMEVLASAAIAGSMAWAASSQQVSPEVLVSFVATLVLLYQPAKDLGRVSQFAIAAAAGLERIHELLLASPKPALVESDVVLAPLAREIAFDDVRFAWGERVALDGATFSIEAGKVTALVGASGSGKSTAVSLLLRFESPASGAIRIDGTESTRATLDSVRSQFALVTQDALLFSTTVRENVALARPGASHAELDAAARVAHALDFILALPEGWDTRIGERGVTLSGGQKQRLCLARAVLAGAPVLVLDEATSHLDPKSEAEVQVALEAATRGRTAVIVAHRLSTIAKADRIVVFNAGRVVEQGTHAQLLERRGVYASLWAQQQVSSPR
ncbi:MAG: ABC transporter ATP-binding protein [Archangium sp.]|nr:ABC transporter ATP-binding protein [Archangium sp.]